MFPAYIVEYVRFGKEESFITKEHSRAAEYAAQHNGTITPLVKWLETDDNNKVCQPSSMIKEVCCLPQVKIATQRLT